MDQLGRVRSVQTMWGNPEAGELAERAVPWRGYHYDLEGRLTTAFEHPGLVEPVKPSSVAGRSIGHDDLDDLEDLNPGGQLLAGIADHRNSVVGWWNIDTGQMEHVIEYTPLGRLRLLAPDGSVLCEEEGTGRDCVREFGLPQFGFAAAYRSEHSGLTTMRNRWYSARLGQFLSHDPLGYVDSHNLYTYAAHDPINFWDPYGLASGGFSPLLESLLNSELAHPNALGETTDPSIYDGEQYGFEATKTAARVVASESVGLLFGGPLDALAIGVGRHVVSKVPALGHIGRGVGAAVTRGTELLGNITARSLGRAKNWLKGLSQQVRDPFGFGKALDDVELKGVLDDLAPHVGGADEVVRGFRAVSRAEADDIARHGFRPDPSGLGFQEGKWFSETREGAETFRRTFSDLDDVVETGVPKAVYERSLRHPNIDGTGPGFCVQCSDLPLLPKP